VVRISVTGPRELRRRLDLEVRRLLSIGKLGKIETTKAALQAVRGRQGIVEPAQIGMSIKDDNGTTRIRKLDVKVYKSL